MHVWGIVRVETTRRGSWSLTLGAFLKHLALFNQPCLSPPSVVGRANEQTLDGKNGGSK
jgi:hypothetical protein